MANVNKTIIAGNLTRDPDCKSTNSGQSVCQLGLAINRRYKTQAGEQREETTFIDVEVWGKQAEFCRDYLRKGNPVLVEGRLKTESWEDRNTGQKRSKLKVVAENVQSLAQRQDQVPQQQVPQQQVPQQNCQPYQLPPQNQPPPPFPAQQPPPAEDPGLFNPNDESIDDIPFN